MIELQRHQLEEVSGGFWAHFATAIAIADAGYEFWQGYSAHRNKD